LNVGKGSFDTNGGKYEHQAKADSAGFGPHRHCADCADENYQQQIICRIV
jgi:hypothetical protein